MMAESERMSVEAAVVSLAERIIAQLPRATWDYNAEIGEMNVVLPGGGGREAQLPWLELDRYWDIYLRLDAETGRPLSVVIAPFDVWLAKQESLPCLPPGVPGQPPTHHGNPLDLAAARKHLQSLLRASPQLTSTAHRKYARLTHDG